MQTRPVARFIPQAAVRWYPMVAIGARRQPAPASGVFFARHRGGLSACYPTALLRTCAGSWRRSCGSCGQRLLKRYRKIRDSLLVFVTDRGVPYTNNASERAVRPSAIFHKVTNGFRSEWGAAVFGAVRSVITTGRLNDLTTLEAIRATIEQRSVLKPT